MNNAITIRSDELLHEIRSEVAITSAEGDILNDRIKRWSGVWDTGATATCIPAGKPVDFEQ